MSLPIWHQTVPPEERRLLELADPTPLETEVLIIGAGMIGLATAWYLSAAGVSGICVVDRGPALGEASGANAGGLWFAQQSPQLGPLVPLARESSRLYTELAATPGFQFDFRRLGVLELIYDEPDCLDFVREAGFQAERIDSRELLRLEPALAATSAGAIYYAGDAQLNPLKLGVCFIRNLKPRGVRFCRGARESWPKAATTVIAAGAWTPLVTQALGWSPPIRPMRGQLLATIAVPPLLRHTILGRHYYYWQLTEGYVAGGGTVEDVAFDRGVDPDDLARIREEMDSLIPTLSGSPMECAWSGFRPYCEDLMPVIGKVPGQDRVYVAAGHFKKGIMLAPVTGKIVADLILRGRTDLPISLADPARFPRVAQ